MPTLTCNVLVVEDDPAVLKALRRKLRQAGHTVESVTHCEAARKLTRTFDFAILDLELPDGSGADLAEELLSHARVSNVVFYTGAADPKLLARATELGLVVSKSQNLDEFLQNVYQALSPPPVSELHETGRWRVAQPTREQSR